MPSDKSTKAPIPAQVMDTALKQWGDSGRQSTFNVSGKSMEPFLVAGDELLIRHGWDNIHTGGLIAYRQGDSLVVHRLLRIFSLRGERVMLLRGDNNNFSDPLIPVDKLVGSVTAITRGDRTFQIDTPLWIGTSFIIAFFARFPLTLEQWIRGIQRRWFPNHQPGSATKIRRLMIQAFALPGHFLVFLLWKFSKYAPL